MRRRHFGQRFACIAGDPRPDDDDAVPSVDDRRFGEDFPCLLVADQGGVRFASTNPRRHDRDELVPGYSADLGDVMTTTLLFRQRGQPIIHVQHVVARPGAAFFPPGTSGLRDKG